MVLHYFAFWGIIGQCELIFLHFKIVNYVKIFVFEFCEYFHVFEIYELKKYVLFLKWLSYCTENTNIYLVTIAIYPQVIIHIL